VSDLRAEALQPSDLPHLHVCRATAWDLTDRQRRAYGW